jgi:hypothetical protein
MGSSVEIYVKYSGDRHGLAHRVAQDLRVVSYFDSGYGHVLPLDAQRWIGMEGWGHLDLDPSDLGQYGEPGLAQDTAFAPYEYELALSFRGGLPAERDEVLTRFGRAVFDQLTALGLPLAYGGSGLVFADFVPGRGVREFPAETDAEDEGRTWWFEPQLHVEPTASWPGKVASLAPPPGPVTVFETNGLLQFVPVVHQSGHWRCTSPVASTRSTVSPRDIGLMLGYAQRTTAQPAGDEDQRILSSLAGKAQLSIEDFARRRVSIEIRADDDDLVAIPHTSGPGQSGRHPSGPAVDGLARRLAIEAEPEVLGQLLIDLVAAMRSPTRMSAATATMERPGLPRALRDEGRRGQGIA